MEIIIVGALAFAGYKMFRHTTRAGHEAVRAYAYLEALNICGSTESANRDAATIMRDIYSEEMRCIALAAKHQLRVDHGGKQLSLIGYAYRRGMETSMPVWYQRIARSAPELASLETIYGTAHSAAYQSDMRRDAQQLPTTPI